jgi:adenosylcobinamide kinase / adenosylcobinamide-phosphate guanylyltransferase
MGELESNLADVVANQHGRCLFDFIPLRARALPRARGDVMQSTHRNTVTLVLGGVRSGKSHYAQQLGECAKRVIFVATAQAGDEEMRRKVDLHRSSRPHHWQTVEEPLGLAEVIGHHGSTCDLMIIDCLTFFAANLLDAKGDDHVSIEHAIEALCLSLQSPACSVVLVSNEVGSGVVPAYPSGRRFRDLLGEMNQRVARVASNVLLLVAGLPLVLKGQAGVNQ